MQAVAGLVNQGKEIVQSVLPGKADMMAVSKYVLAYEKSQYLNGFEYWEDGNI